MQHRYGDRHIDDLQFSLAKMRQQLALGANPRLRLLLEDRLSLRRARPSQDGKGTTLDSPALPPARAYAKAYSKEYTMH
jgi:hypothetical protein